MTTSALRTISLGPGALAWPMAEPDDVLDYALDVSSALLDASDTILSATIGVAPSGQGELAAVSLNVEGSVIVAWLADGVAGRNYVVRVEAITNGGRTFEWLVSLLVNPRLASYPLPPAPSQEFALMPSQAATPLTNSASGTMGQTATIVVPFSATRKWLMFSNRSTGSETQDIGSSDVTLGGGIPVFPGGGFLFNGTGASGPIYGITTVPSSPFSYVEG